MEIRWLCPKSRRSEFGGTVRYSRQRLTQFISMRVLPDLKHHGEAVRRLSVSIFLTANLRVCSSHSEATHGRRNNSSGTGSWRPQSRLRVFQEIRNEIRQTAAYWDLYSPLLIYFPYYDQCDKASVKTGGQLIDFYSQYLLCYDTESFCFTYFT